MPLTLSHHEFEKLQRVEEMLETALKHLGLTIPCTPPNPQRISEMHRRGLHDLCSRDWPCPAHRHYPKHGENS